MGDASTGISKPDSPYITDLRVEKIAMDSGRIQIRIDVDEAFYYEMLSEMTGSQIDGEYSLIAELKELSKLKNEYESVRDAFTSVDLITYIHQMASEEDGIWNTNIFGKSVEDLVMDGMRNKMAVINDESQTKLQDTMQKIVNDSNGGLVCIII